MTTTKTARKRRSPDSPKPTKSANDREFSVVPVENFQGVSRGKVSQFLGAARALLDAKDGTGIVMAAPEGCVVENYRTYLYTALKTAMKQLGEEGKGVTLTMSQDRKTFLATLRK